MLAGRAGEIVSRRETPSQCGRVGSPGVICKSTRTVVGTIWYITSCDVEKKFFLKWNPDIIQDLHLQQKRCHHS